MALAVAGCSGHAPGRGQAVSAQRPPEPPGILHLGECSGFRASTLPAPEAASPARPPPGWQPQAGPSTIDLLALACTRLSLGPIERGPVHLVAESHSDFSAPAACTADGRSSRTFLVTLAVDDAALAEHLHASYGLPAMAAGIAVRVDATGAVVRTTWTWGPPGQPPSELTFLDDGGRRADANAQRFFWMTEGAVGLLDLDHDRLRSVDQLAGEGTMREPMLLAGEPGGRFAGAVEPFDGMTADGVFRLYRDGACLEPRR